LPLFRKEGIISPNPSLKKRGNIKFEEEWFDHSY
jgi:hypothetical protein